jgi:hypothetical protein
MRLTPTGAHPASSSRLLLAGSLALLIVISSGCARQVEPPPATAGTQVVEPSTPGTPTTPPVPDEPQPSRPSSPRVPAPAPAPADIPVRPAADALAGELPRPVRVVVDALDIDMEVEALGVAPDGTMELPETGLRAAWYRYGSAPSSAAGVTLLAAHADTRSTGLGPFARLVDAEVGSAVVVTDESGEDVTYTVTERAQVAKSEIALDDLFSREGPRRLVLVTCGGVFDRSTGHYVDNVVVTAVPAS